MGASRFVLMCLLGSATLLVSLAAFAWTSEALFSTRVHDHSFDKVTARSEGCSVHYRLSFSAPPEAYASKSPERDYYRFRAHLKFASGDVMTTPAFGNRAPGRRVYVRTQDTTQDGCWANAKQQLVGLDIESCRGRGCTPKAPD